MQITHKSGGMLEEDHLEVDFMVLMVILVEEDQTLVEAYSLTVIHRLSHRQWQFGSYGRGQQMQFHISAPKNITHPTGNSSINYRDPDEQLPIFQICHKQGHTAYACWHR